MGGLVRIALHSTLLFLISLHAVEASKHAPYLNPVCSFLGATHSQKALTEHSRASTSIMQNLVNRSQYPLRVSSDWEGQGGTYVAKFPCNRPMRENPPEVDKRCQ